MGVVCGCGMWVWQEHATLDTIWVMGSVLA